MGLYLFKTISGFFKPAPNLTYRLRTTAIYLAHCSAGQLTALARASSMSVSGLLATCSSGQQARSCLIWESLTHMSNGCLAVGWGNRDDWAKPLSSSSRQAQTSSLGGLKVPKSSKKESMLLHSSSLCLHHTCYCPLGQSKSHGSLESEAVPYAWSCSLPYFLVF